MTRDSKTEIDNVCKTNVKTTKCFQVQHNNFREYFNVLYNMYYREEKERRTGEGRFFFRMEVPGGAKP